MERFRSEPPASTLPADRHGRVDHRTCVEAFSGSRGDLASQTEQAWEWMEEACRIERNVKH